MKKMTMKVLAAVLTLVLLLGMMPNFTMPAKAVATDAQAVTDPGTADTWEEMLGTDADGSRYAGRVWVDKSVYKDGDTVTLNQKNNADSTFTVDVDEANGEYFQVVFSALGSSMSTNTTVIGSRPMDVVLILDNSVSMNTVVSNRTTRMQYLIEAANDLLAELLENNDVRLGIVAYSQDASTVLPFSKYTGGVVLGVNSYTGTGSRNGVITAYNNAGQVINSNYKSNGYANYTNTQAGIEMGMGMLANATNTENRKPIVIVMTDGAANTAKDRMFVSGQNGTVRQVYHSSDIDPMIALSTLLSAAYNKVLVEKHYGQAPVVYGVGADLSDRDGSNAIIDPGANFNGSNTNENIREAYKAYTETWATGNDVSITSGGYSFRFQHSYPQSGITDRDIIANINYVDDYYPVNGVDMDTAFDSIYEQMMTSAFNPITSTSTGATGVKETPLIYADNIGKYMQVKDIQALQVFGNTYNVTKNADGTYSVAAGSGTNPATNERWTTDDIEINVIEKDDGTQQLRVYIHQEILPVSLDKITSTTENKVTTHTLEVTEQAPLRLYYTLGIDESILLPNGQVDMTKVDSDYAYINDDGTVSFYANAFGDMNMDDLDDDGLVELGDAHVGFVPSHENRYYYHQNYQNIFVSATDANGNDISWEDGEYGVRWVEGAYKVEKMSYADYASMKDSDEVYNFVTFIRPTGSGNAAEEVTYLVYTTWGDLKETVTFHDTVNDVKINGGTAIDVGSVASVVSAYKQGKNIADTDLVAVMGLQSQRVSRLHNMFEYKAQNNTDSAELAYAPAYNKGAHDDGDIHEHSEVIVWLGNNGKLTVPMGTGLMVTKRVAEVADGASADEKFPISVLLNMNYAADVVAGLSFTDGDGNALSSNDYTVENSNGGVLVTFHLADGESAIILGLADGVSYTVTEAEHSKYTYTYNGANETVSGEIAEGVVTNQPIKAGNLYITKEVEHSVEGEPFPTDYEFDFAVTFVDKDGNPIANTTFQLENNHDATLTQLTTDGNGVMRGKLCHGETTYIKGIPAGAVVTVEEVNIPDNYTSTVYRSRNITGETADNDGVVTIYSDATATVVVTNTYTPKSTSVDLELYIEKTLRVDAEPTWPMYFGFAVEKWDGSAWKGMHETGMNFSDGNKVSDGVYVGNTSGKVIELGEFTEAGSYAFQAYEIYPDAPIAGMTYDRTVYTLTVTVTDVNGQLVAVVTDQNGNVLTDTDQDGNLEFKASFTNEAHAAPVSVDVFKEVDNKSGNPEVSKAGFEFVAVQTNENWQPLTGDNASSLSVITDGTGEARMSATYREAGNYYYLVSEVTPDPKPAGWSYTDKTYKVQVVVTKDDTTGDLTANLIVDGVDLRSDDADLTFTNTYDPADAEVELNTLVKKSLEGRDLIKGEFTFAIFENGKAVISDEGKLTNPEKAVATGTNDTAGNVAFTPEKLTFSKVGKYAYDVIEIKDDLGGVTYDGTIYDLVVEVTDNGDGTLAANYYFEDSVSQQVVFKNTYTVTDTEEVVIDGLKTLDVLSGTKTMKAGDYTFCLYNEAGEKIGETTNLANGTFKFDAIKYTVADLGKTYTYTVKEAGAGTTVGGVTYSDQTFTVTVKIVDNGDGTMGAEVTGNGKDNIHFVNTYAANYADVILTGSKELNGRDLTAGEFKFALYQADMNFENLVLVDDTITHDAAGKITVSINDLNEGAYHYVLMEAIPENRALGVRYDTSEYQITIQVTDAGNGQMEAQTTVYNPGSANVQNPAISFVNAYRPEDGEIVLSGTKTYQGGRALADDVFSVGLYEGTTLLQTAYIKADGTFTFQPQTFTAEDVGETFTYTVGEIIPEDATDNGDGTKTSGNNIYDATVYTVVVSVADADKDGALEITKTVNGTADGSISFTNTFVPTPVEAYVKIVKNVENLSNPGITAEGFEFVIALGQESATDVSNAEGVAGFTINLDVEDIGQTYEFKVSEKKGSKAGVTYDDTVYTVVVAVTADPEDGSLIVTMNGEQTNLVEVEFTNTYEKPAVPVTGDSFRLFLVVGLLAVSAAAVVILLVFKKKSNKGKFSA